MIEVGIIGYGFVGKAVGQMAVKGEIRAVPFDPYIEEYCGPKQMMAAYDADIVFVCVPTPSDPEDRRLDVSIVLDAAKKWSELTQKDDSVLVIKSTIPVGTVDEMCDLFETDRIVHNPEFLTERTAMRDFMEADEIIVGGPNKKACSKVLGMYKVWFEATRNLEDPLSRDARPQLRQTDAKTAEMVKMVRNSFYALKVTYMNEVHELCRVLGVDYKDFRQIFARSGKHAWVNPQHTYVPGPDGKYGYGGKCLVKDALGLAALADSHGVSMDLLKTTNKQNKLRRPDEY